MTQLTIQEKNTVIALFNGYEKYEDSSGVWFKKEGEIVCMHIKSDGLKYHSSWDWLMPVIEKICRIEFIDSETCYLRTFGMISEDNLFMVRFNRYPLYTGKSLIEAAHEAVFQFIQSYNQNNLS